jgi:hypothetical protein
MKTPSSDGVFLWDLELTTYKSGHIKYVERYRAIQGIILNFKLICKSHKLDVFINVIQKLGAICVAGSCIFFLEHFLYFPEQFILDQLIP